MRRLIGTALAVALLVTGCAESEKPVADAHTVPPKATQPPVSAELAGKLAAARAASAPYVTDLAAAEKAGYVIIRR